MFRQYVRRAIGAVTPPIFWRLMAAPSTSGPAYVPLRATLPDMGPRELNYLLDDPVMVIPFERVRYPYATRFTYDEHHFLRYYVDGLGALRHFYESHQPRTIFESYHLTTRNEDATEASPIGCPWFKRGRAHRGENGLGPEHGRQHQGPVTERKLQLEASRLDTVLASLERLGFRPDMGYPQGYFLLRERGDWVFVVRGGLHRTAALAHLGSESLEVRFLPHYPRIVHEREVTAWPMVREGIISVDGALAIFRQFFAPSIPYPGG